VGDLRRRESKEGESVIGTFTPDEPLSRDRERGAEAIERLEERGRPPTARVFAAGSVLRESPLSLEAVLVGYARQANELDVRVGPSVREDLGQLCEAANEQGYAVDVSRVLERTTPSTTVEALAAARRQLDAPPNRRSDRLAAFVQDARTAGIDISMDDFEGMPGIDDGSPQCRSGSHHALVDGSDQAYVEPPVADRPTEVTTVAAANGVYAGDGGGDSGQIAVDGGEQKPPADDTGDAEGRPDHEETTGADSEETACEAAPNTTTATAGRTGRSTEDRREAESDHERDGAVIPTYEAPESGSQNGRQSAHATAASDTEGPPSETASSDATAEETSGFVWPAADDDVDPDVSPTVRIGEHTDEKRREGPAALVTEDRAGESVREIHEAIALANREEAPPVRIIGPDRTDGGPPDPRTLTASLSATGTSVTDALD